MTTTQLQLRRDTTANVGAITPAQGEPIYDVTRGALVLGNGSTPGGLCVTPFTGTWTPQLEFGGASVGMTFSSEAGTWVQIGPFIIATFIVILSAKGSSTGAASITGLPQAQTGQNGVCIIGYHGSLNSSPDAIEALVNGSAVTLGKTGATTTASMADTDFTNTSQLQGVAIYLAAQPTG